MGRPLIRGAVLVVVIHPEDRRTLFETFDRYEFDAIFTAKDFTQAYALLKQQPRIDVALLEFSGDGCEARAFCEALRRLPSPIPVVGIASEAFHRQHWSWQGEPPGMEDWVRSPVLGPEALHRVQRLLRVQGASAGTAQTTDCDAASGSNAHALDVALKISQIRHFNAAGPLFSTLEQWLKPDATWLVLQPAAGEKPVLVRQSGAVRPDEALWNAVFRLLAQKRAVVIHQQASDALKHEPAVAELGFESLAMIPVTDDRQALVGALVLGAFKSWGQDASIEGVLHVAAARVGLELELTHAREQGRAKGLQDSLTGLPNRLLFNDRLENTIQEAHRTGETFAVLFVDIDRFKNINDSLGHSIGDEVLVAAANRLRSSVRGADTVARYAGDEFTLVLRHITQREDVLRIAEKMCRVLESPLTLHDGRDIHITASIGISFYPLDATTPDKLLQHADTAMYSAKNMGRNTFQTYVSVPEESHQQRLALEAKLRQAERNQELRVHYQPQIDARHEDIVGVEALIRWEHPELGMISPGFFIPLAEETGLILSIGEWVLRQACGDAQRWHKEFELPLRVSVNLSALQLKQPNLAEVVQRVLNETGLLPQALELEVTESISVKSIPNLLETLQAIRRMGCGIAIDDFGTGQSSLDYIRRFPADRIKIDQVFVRNIGVDPDDEAIVKATIHMAHSLGRQVVAEGVEREEHFDFLRDQGCEQLQGYLFARPIPGNQFRALLLERARLLEQQSTDSN